MLERAYSGIPRTRASGTTAAILLAMLATTSLLLMSYAHPVLPIAVAIPLTLLVTFYFFPTAGIYAWLFLFPVQSIYMEFSAGWRVHRIYPFELLAFIILPVLLAKVLSEKPVSALNPPRAADSEFPWIYFFSAAFIAWSMLCFFLSGISKEAIVTWWRLMADFILSAFLIVYLDRFEKFIRLIIFFCLFAAILSVIAVYSNHYGLDLSYRLLSPGPFAIKFLANFLNVSGNFDPRMVGMAFSSGISSRHELGIFLTCATVLAVFLIRHFKITWFRALLALLILLYAMTQMLIIPKASLLGFLLSIVFLLLLVPQWRELTLPAVGGILGLWAVGNFLSNLVKPHWMTQVGLATSVGNLANQSAFKPGTMGNRFKLMGEAIDMFLKSYGLGGGPDSLFIYEFQGVHGHNLFLSYAADYGMLGVIFAAGMLILLGRLAWSKVLARPRIEDPVWLLRFGILCCLLISVFEYSFDCYIWYPHLWFFGALFLASLRLGDEAPSKRTVAFELN